MAGRVLLKARRWREKPMPTVIIPLTLLGLVPFFVLAFRSLSVLPLVAQVSVMGLIDYAALILAFIGGVHWGLALLPETARPTLRAVAGGVSVLAAWVCIFLAQGGSPPLPPGVLGLAHLGTVFVGNPGGGRA